MKNFLINKNTYKFVHIKDTLNAINNIPKPNFLLYPGSKIQSSVTKHLTYSLIKSIRLFSTTKASLSPTRDELNREIHIQRLIKIDNENQNKWRTDDINRKTNKRNNDDDYRRHDDHLSDNIPKDEKLRDVEDYVATAKGDYKIKLWNHKRNGLPDTHPDVKKTTDEYNNDMKALNEALKDNKLEKKIDPSLEVNDHQNSAIKYRTEELKQKNLEARDNNVEQYKKEVEEYLKNQSQSEPLDFWDPDG